MSPAKPQPVVNRLIAALPRKERERVAALCEPVDLAPGMTLCESDRPFRHAYFPLTGCISLVTTLGGHRPLELGLIGAEGMLGVTLVLGVNAVPVSGVVQVAGTALRMTAQSLRAELAECPAFLRTLNRYLYVWTAQLAQTAACTHFHETGPRLARWLLMTHDRAHGDHFHLTHQVLADMLGVQRSAVTIAAGALQKRKLISYSRGVINVLSRKGLEAASCECYDAVVDDYAQVFP